MKESRLHAKSNRLIRVLRKCPKWYVVIFLVLYLPLQRYLNDSNTPVFASTEVRVIDGDTIVLDGIKIRLQGIDAPESKQTCARKIDKQVCSCGTAATEKLTSLIADQEVKCTDEGRDKYQRQLSYCYAGDVNLNAEMVKQGYALAYTHYDIIFFLDELYARWHNHGIWASNFVNPSDWRKQQYNRMRN
jgi:endonuclease YncB( thermonuclease family)